MTCPAAIPCELARRVAIGEFPPEVRAWLKDAFSRYLVDAEPIETALRLDRASRMKQRDDALREAGRLLRLPKDENQVWPVAERLAKAVKYHARLPREPLTPVEKAVAKAFAAYQRVPCTPHGLYRLLL